METKRYSVIVGNVGMVHETNNLRDARFCARTYVAQSKSGRGRCADEPVTVMDGYDIIDEYRPANTDRED